MYIPAGEIQTLLIVGYLIWLLKSFVIIIEIYEQNCII